MNPSLDSDYRKEDRQILITYAILGVMLLSLLIMTIIFAFRVDAAPKLEPPTKKNRCGNRRPLPSQSGRRRSALPRTPFEALRPHPGNQLHLPLE